MSKHLSETCKISNAILPAAGVAASTDLNGTSLNMAGWDGVLMVVTFGAITTNAVTSICAQQDTATAMSSAADLLGTGQTIADNDDEKTFYIDLKRPAEAFVRLVVKRATQNAVVASAIYIQYNGRSPVVSHGTAVAGEKWHGPIEGTA